MNEHPKENATTPLASVVVITRNRADSLTRALQALTKLDYPAYEIIVVDNGSTDHTAQVVAEFSAKYVFCPAGSGFSITRQRGVEAAQGEIIAMCDDDCVPQPDWLQHLVRRLLSKADLALVGGQVINIGFTGNKIYKGRSKLGRNGELNFVADPNEAEFFGNMNLAFKRSAVQAMGGYDPFLMAGLEEIDLVMSLRQIGFTVEYDPAAIVKHYFTGVSFKRGRFFYDSNLMRLYFFLKHFQPRTMSEWLRFLENELRIVGQDVARWSRALGSATIKGKFWRLPAVGIEFFNLTSSRLVIPWLLWRSRSYRYFAKQKVPTSFAKPTSAIKPNTKKT